MIFAVIMAGGGGTRFWPRSRAKRPKQFLTITGERTLLQSTLDRIAAQAGANHCWVITSAAHSEEARKQLPELPSEQVVGEPMGRDTTACIALAAALLARRDPSAMMLVMPADHVIEPEQEFRRAVHAAEQVIADHPAALVTFGIQPTFPSTGYGYIHRGSELGRRQNVPAFRVQAFKEKPSADVAQKFLASGEYYWNSGIFAWRVQTILNELQTHVPGVYASAQRIAAAWQTPEREEVFRKEYASIEKVSIDYAVMERAKEVIVLQAPYRWDDVGSWLALERLHPQDADGNTILADHTGLKTSNCVIVGDAGRLITTIGVKDLVIVQDGDAILIADRRDEGTVKQLVDKLKESGRAGYL